MGGGGCSNAEREGGVVVGGRWGGCSNAVRVVLGVAGWWVQHEGRGGPLW